MAEAIPSGLPAWLCMWLLAAAIFAGCKALTWQRALAAGARPSPGRSLGYLFLWPGMDARAFLGADRVVPLAAGQWRAALLKTALGAALVWGAARHAVPWSPWLAAWLGMAGVVLMLHFGAFHLLAMAWQRAGVRAEPIMCRPALSVSVAEFWGSRWNLGFHQLAHELVFTPLRRRLGVSAAAFVVFLTSGLVHDLVISAPAGGGYGLPTLYFAIQAPAVMAERSAAGRRLGLRGGMRGRVYTVLAVAAPSPLLFHAPFVDRVILPMLRAWGAI